MTKFTRLQKAKCVCWLAELKTPEKVQQKFQEEFSKYEPNLQVPNELEILKWYENFNRSGAFEITSIVNPVNAEKDEDGIDIHSIDYANEQGFLKFMGFHRLQTSHPYKMHLDGCIVKEDYWKRKKFAEFLLDHLPTHAPNQIWFGGEATFFSNGRVECHHITYLSDTDADEPTQPRTGSQITIWAALNYDGIIGPYLFVGEPNYQIIGLAHKEPV